MKSHFTTTGFVVEGKRTILLWHKRLGMWVPPGGHIEPDEDPVTAVLREIREETGLEAEVIPTAREMNISYPQQIQPPYTILLEDSGGKDRSDGPSHKHIDFIYFCRPVGTVSVSSIADQPMQWAEESAILSGQPLKIGEAGPDISLSEDVRILALKAIELASHCSQRKQQA